MNLLFKREQGYDIFRRTNFKLWGKIELDEDETAILRRYRFQEAVLIVAIQFSLVRNAILIGLGVWLVVWLLFSMGAGFTGPVAVLFSFICGAGGGFWYFNEKRETIFVRDLLHGRHFTCSSVIDLARKEAWLRLVVSYLRQVMESAKHWDGTERNAVEPLPPEEAKEIMIRGVQAANAL